MGIQRVRRAAAAASLIACSVVLPSAMQGQALVRGVLYDDGTGLPVRGTVMLVDPASDAPVIHAVTDTLGRFALRIGDGAYQLAAVTPGYTSVLSAVIPLVSGESMTLSVPIRRDGDPSHQIAVTNHVRPQTGSLRQVAEHGRMAQRGNYDGRVATGTGLHFDRSAFDHTNASTLGGFLESVPGLRLSDPTAMSSLQMSRNMAMAALGSRGLAPCHVGWFVDGHRMDLPGRTDPLTDGLGSMQLDAIDAIEVFRGISEMPPEFSAPDLRCGAIAVWTRNEN